MSLTSVRTSSRNPNSKLEGYSDRYVKDVKPPYGPRIDDPVTRTFLILVTLLSKVTRTSSFYRIWYIALIRPLGSFYAVVVGPRSLSHLICPIARV